jgi:uncharacterized protein
MTIVYFDSSAFVKLLVEEPGSKLAAALWNGCDAAVSSRLAYPEVRAVLASAGRALRLDATEQSHAESLWEDFWAATRPVEFTEPVAAHAGELASSHSLRGADAVHLASLLAVSSTETVFAVWGERLRAAAAAAGLAVAPTG